MPKQRAELPKTVEGAVRLMMGLVPEGEQTRVAHMREEDLTGLHMSLGQWVRNNLGLWDENTALLGATGESNADDASEVIVKAFWVQLRRGLPKVH
jgi:hypothetical protein